MNTQQRTETQYREIYAKLQKEEQDSLKAYNQWLIQMRMAIKSYNTLIQENHLEHEFDLIHAETDEEIDSLNIESIQSIYAKIQSAKEVLVEKIELALGLKTSEEVSLIEDKNTTDEPIVNSNSLEIETEGFNFEDFEGISISQNPLSE